MAELFKLDGGGATGLLISGAHAQAVEKLPDMVCLGRRPPDKHQAAPRLEAYVDALKVVPPPRVDWFSKAAVSIARIYRNNVKGCCVVSGAFHQVGIWTGNDADSAGGQVIVGQDGEVDQQYVAVCGAGDRGCNIQTFLNYMQRTGVQVGGKRYKIKGYARFDARSKELWQIAIMLGGALKIGFNLPGAWMNSAIWDVSNAGRIVGGHDVAPCGFGPMPAGDDTLPPEVRAKISPAASVVSATPEGIIVASWGRLYLMTWAAATSGRFVDEAYLVVPEFIWTGLDKVAPNGVNLDALGAAMDVMRGGGVPDLPEPPPPVDPTPDPPPIAGISFVLPGGGLLTANYAKKEVTYPQGWTGRNV